MGFSYFLKVVSLSLIFIVNNLAEAQNCNADNLLRALRRQGAPAKIFCDKLLNYDVPAVTVVLPPGVTPQLKTRTTTSEITRSVYPEGQLIETVSFPSYVSSSPATRISSGCSCLLGPRPTTTSTSSGPTITQTIIATKTKTVTGPCATLGVIAAQEFIPEPDQNVVVLENSKSNSFDCCKTCNAYRPGLCLAFFAIPGESCNIITVDKRPENPPFCPNIQDSVSFFVFINKYPTRIGGRGVCGVNFFLFP